MSAPGAGSEPPSVTEMEAPLSADGLRANLAALHAEQPGPRQAATRRIGAATRLLIERLVATSAPPERLERMAERLEALAGELDGYERRRLYEGFAESSVAGRSSAFFDWSPMLGQANPLAPPIAVRVEGDAVVGDVRFGSAYEGPPGCVHGGYLAAAFDDVLGLAQAVGGRPAMTATLEIRYRSPTPLHAALRFEARVVERSGRKLTVVGTCSATDSVTAEAKALFIQVTPERFRSLLAERERRQAGG
ncbi:MAG TPA: PaaI family thioesterase [Acidimicrobiales bacterium]|nr:PaaI family thioesterase [Acidimicrobiales bacterium]